jgi:hypothetical protein
VHGAYAAHRLLHAPDPASSGLRGRRPVAPTVPAPLAAVQASAQDTAEAAAGLLLSVAALAADTLAALLSPTELAAEVIERATHTDRSSSQPCPSPPEKSVLVSCSRSTAPGV